MIKGGTLLPSACFLLLFLGTDKARSVRACAGPGGVFADLLFTCRTATFLGIRKIKSLKIRSLRNYSAPSADFISELSDRDQSACSRHYLGCDING